MKTVSLGRFAVLFAMLIPILAVMAGCGNDEAPPDDPSYYKGPMKPKSSDPSGGGVEGGGGN
jgi:hypothetical protein